LSQEWISYGRSGFVIIVTSLMRVFLLLSSLSSTSSVVLLLCYDAAGSPRRDLDLRLPSLQNLEPCTSVVYDLPSVWYSVTEAENGLKQKIGAFTTAQTKTPWRGGHVAQW
jgi:hypothetical protein